MLSQIVATKAEAAGNAPESHATASPRILGDLNICQDIVRILCGEVSERLLGGDADMPVHQLPHKTSSSLITPLGHIARIGLP